MTIGSFKDNTLSMTQCLDDVIACVCVCASWVDWKFVPDDARTDVLILLSLMQLFTMSKPVS